MNDSEKTEIKLRGQLLAQRLVIAILLAREAVTHGGIHKLKDIHGALIQDIASSCQEVDAIEVGGKIGQIEAEANAELDKLFGLASDMYAAMPDK